jgi:hypothetical protein
MFSGSFSAITGESFAWSTASTPSLAFSGSVSKNPPENLVYFETASLAFSLLRKEKLAGHRFAILSNERRNHHA